MAVKYLSKEKKRNNQIMEFLNKTNRNKKQSDKYLIKISIPKLLILLYMLK
jgi:hypothetical protein